MEQRTIVAPPVGEAPWAGLMAQHERLVHWLVHRQGWDGLTYAAAVQAGRIGLWQALQGYDPTRGTRFSSYAVPVIRHAVWRAVAQQRRADRAAGAARGAAPVVTVEPDRALAQAEVAAAVRALVRALPPRRRRGLPGATTGPRTHRALPVARLAVVRRLVPDGRRTGMGMTKPRAHASARPAALHGVARVPWGTRRGADIGWSPGAGFGHRAIASC